MKVSEDFKNYVEEQLSVFEPVLIKKMFGLWYF